MNRAKIITTVVVVVCALFRLIDSFKAFPLLYVLTNGGPGRATEVMTTYSYQLYAQGNYGMSTAMNTLLMVLSLTIGLLIVRSMTKKEVQQ